MCLIALCPHAINAFTQVETITIELHGTGDQTENHGADKRSELRRMLGLLSTSKTAFTSASVDTKVALKIV